MSFTSTFRRCRSRRYNAGSGLQHYDQQRNPLVRWGERYWRVTGEDEVQTVSQQSRYPSARLRFQVHLLLLSGSETKGEFPITFNTPRERDPVSGNRVFGPTSLGSLSCLFCALFCSALSSRCLPTATAELNRRWILLRHDLFFIRSALRLATVDFPG